MKTNTLICCSARGDCGAELARSSCPCVHVLCTHVLSPPSLLLFPCPLFVAPLRARCCRVVCIFPGYFPNFLSSSARVSPLSHFLKCLRSSADRQLRLDRQLSPPHPGESRPPRWSVCHNKSVCRRCSNACEGLCVLVRGGLGGTLGCHTCQPGMR